MAGFPGKVWGLERETEEEGAMKGRQRGALGKGAHGLARCGYSTNE